MTGLQHGIATVGTRGPLTDSELDSANGRSLLLADVTSEKQFVEHVLDVCRDPMLRGRLGREGQAMYERNYSWNRIVSRLLSVLGRPDMGDAATPVLRFESRPPLAAGGDGSIE